ncbi:MAG TPA: RsbRD N-terminal domain-containing protein, partial [Telluria sp.]
MSTQDYSTRISQIIQDHQDEIGAEWVGQLEALTVRSNAVSKDQLRKHCQQFLAAFANGTRGGELQNIEHRSWDELRDLLDEISTTRAKGGSTPSETATFVFSLKQPLFSCLNRALASDPVVLAHASWTIGTLLDKMGLY